MRLSHAYKRNGYGYLVCIIAVLFAFNQSGSGTFVETPHGFEFDEVSPDQRIETQGFYQQYGFDNKFPEEPMIQMSGFASSFINSESARLANWPNPEVEKQLGDITGAAIGSGLMDEVFLLHRADRIWNEKTFDEENRLVNATTIGPIRKPTIAVIRNGSIVREGGANMFYMPHGISLDDNGNLWITDTGSHQVFKFRSDNLTHPILVLGSELNPGSKEGHFCKPTHAVAASTGEIFVSDGYCNSRILKFSKEGKLIKFWGEKSKGSLVLGPFELDIPHQLALIEENDAICVADRGHQRVVCYSAGLTYPNEMEKENFNSMDMSGEYLNQLADGDYGDVYGVAYIQQSKQLAILGINTDVDTMSRIYLYDIMAGQQVLTLDGIHEKGFGNAHSLASCPSTNDRFSCLLIVSLGNDMAMRIFQSSTEENSETLPSKHLWLYLLSSDSDE